MESKQLAYNCAAELLDILNLEPRVLASIDGGVFLTYDFLDDKFLYMETVNADPEFMVYILNDN